MNHVALGLSHLRQGGLTMGWKGTMRSIGAAVRAAERDAARQHKIDLKNQQISDAASAVRDWECYIADLLEVHTNLADRMNWRELASRNKPLEPALGSKHSEKAQAKLEGLNHGGFVTRLLGGATKRKLALELALKEAPAKDQADFEKAKSQQIEAVEEWEQDTALARRLITGEAAAIKEVIEEMQALSEEDLIGAAVRFQISDGQLHAIPEVHSDEIIPNYRRKQLASGKLSESKMPIGQFNELYQDYVASVALKVAGDMFQILPLDEVYVTCETTMLNSATGHKEAIPILSVQFVRSSFEMLNLDSIDPSDSMVNFNHRVDFKKSKGFSAIAPLSAF